MFMFDYHSIWPEKDLRFIRNVTDSMNYEQLVTAIDVASQALLGGAAKAFNQALVLRNSLIGAHLIEFEQSGQDRAHTASTIQIGRLTQEAVGLRACG